MSKKKIATTKRFRSFLALFLACVLIFSISACGAKKSQEEVEIKPITVQREPEPQILQLANEATVIALRQYVYARLLTEVFLTTDTSAMTAEELSEMADELLTEWKNATVFSTSAINLTNQSVVLLEKLAVNQISSVAKFQERFRSIAEASLILPHVAQAAEGIRRIDPQSWAENLTKQFDALEGAKRFQQLAQQLGTDARTAYDQMVLAQTIIKNAAELDEAEAMLDAYNRSINYLQGIKTASKVGVFVVGTIVTGGGSISSLGASSLSLGQAGGVIVGGVDCIVDIATTGSTIILGDNNQVALGFDGIKDVLAPVSAVLGLSSLNAAETGEQLAYIGDTLVDWFYDGKVMGVQLDDAKNVTAQIFDNVGTDELKNALENAGYIFPRTSKTLVQIMQGLAADPTAILSQMDALLASMTSMDQNDNLDEQDSADKPEEDSTENVSSPPLSEDIDMFGRYSFVLRSISAEDEEETTSFVTLVDLGRGRVQWIDDQDVNDEELEPFILNYDVGSNKINHFEEGSIIEVVFTRVGGTVMGKGTMTGSIWGERFEATISLTKISD